MISLKEENEEMSIANLARETILEQFDSEMTAVLNNIQDPNTSAIKKRKMTITLTFAPSENRAETTIGSETKLTLAPPAGITTRIFIDKDSKGNLVSGELIRKKEIPGQTNVNAETGEITENKIYKVK